MNEYDDPVTVRTVGELRETLEQLDGNLPLTFFCSVDIKRYPKGCGFAIAPRKLTPVKDTCSMHVFLGKGAVSVYPNSAELKPVEL